VHRGSTRNGKDWTESFPSLSAALKKLPVRDAGSQVQLATLVDTELTCFGYRFRQMV
jgi:ATP-dependent DNA ligase